MSIFDITAQIDLLDELLKRYCMNINKLNQKYAMGELITFKVGQGGLPVAVINNEFAQAEVSIYGAHVLKYQPNGQKDLLWMSPQSIYEVGKPIRGGIPLCFPWFGPHILDSTKPQHGFARLLTWEIISTTVFFEEKTQLVLGLESNDRTKELWPYDFKAQLKVDVGEKLEVTLSYTNMGAQSFICSDALHTYFNVSDIATVKIAGLQGVTYYKGFEKEATGKQAEPYLQIKQEENRRYIKHSGECIIDDAGLNRKIYVSKKGSNVTVVWNPWENARNIPDMPDDGYKTMICVEAVNAYEDVATVDPGKTFSVSTTIWVE